MIDFLIELFFPPKCHFCQKLLERGETDLCHKCRKEAPVFSTPKRNFQLIAQWTAVWYYRGNVKDSIRRFKFYNARSYADFFGKAIAMKLQEDPFRNNFDILTWVPVSPLRRFTRGYDQAELLAQALGRELSMTPVPGLVKQRHTKPQSSIHDRTLRRANVFNAYRGINPTLFNGKRVLLVDDVVTTGSTASECAKMLLVSGATHIYLAAVAAATNEKTSR